MAGTRFCCERVDFLLIVSRKIDLRAYDLLRCGQRSEHCFDIGIDFAVVEGLVAFESIG